ncbi:MAG: glycosyltransferase [Candidatus Atribacteria bacterium]|nr:glycosyltransferase [Candidatus Atribacteria bacterium]
MTKLSIIIPTYNCSLFLPEAIDSVLEQTFQDYEIIVIDDGSTDETEVVISRYGSNIVYIKQENLGPSAARNRGLNIAIGEYIVFLDADDILLPAKLEMQVSFLDHNQDVDVVYSDGYYNDCFGAGGSEQKLFSQIGLLSTGLGAPIESLKILAIRNAFPIHAAMTRKAILWEVKGFDEDLPALEDWDLWFRIAEAHKYAFLDAVLVIYRAIPTGITANFHRQKLASSQLRKKIECSDGFTELNKAIQSDFYFCWGIVDLRFYEKQKALENFKKSLHVNTKNYIARFAFLATLLLGRYALIFYFLKRKLLGVR